MNNYKIIIGLIAIFCGACNWRSEKDKNTLVKQRVYVLTSESDSAMLKHKLIAVRQDTSYLESVFKNNGLVNICEMDSTIQVDLKYADTLNFLKSNFYDGLQQAYLNCEAAIKLCNAQYYLKQSHPEYSLIIYDASRPLHIQQMMWDSLKMPDLKKYQYLSPPSEPSLHNYGCAVDVSIVDLKTNQVLDMGSEFDHFEKLSEPAMEKELLKKGELSPQAYQNRILLRRVMQRAKFNPITTEWWHFSICTKPEALKRFKLIQ